MSVVCIVSRERPMKKGAVLSVEYGGLTGVALTEYAMRNHLVDSAVTPRGRCYSDHLQVRKQELGKKLTCPGHSASSQNRVGFQRPPAPRSAASESHCHSALSIPSRCSCAPSSPKLPRVVGLSGQGELTHSSPFRITASGPQRSGPSSWRAHSITVFLGGLAQAPKSK